MRTDAFIERHVGPNEEEIKKMLATIGVTSIKKLLEETIPETIRLKKPLALQKELVSINFLKL
jgi:glycine dehydrogenase